MARKTPNPDAVLVAAGVGVCNFSVVTAVTSGDAGGEVVVSGEIVAMGEVVVLEEAVAMGEAVVPDDVVVEELVMVRSNRLFVPFVSIVFEAAVFPPTLKFRVSPSTTPSSA